MAIEVVRNYCNNIDIKLGSACGSFCSTIGSIPVAIRRQLNDLCSTDCKVHGLIVLGRMLQAAAILGVATSIFAVVMTGPMVLFGVIPAIATALLGTYMATRPKDVVDAIFPWPPYVTGQPVGLINSGNNCWANASMQLLLRAPNLLTRVRTQQIPQVRQIAQSYTDAQGVQQRVVQGADGQLIRDALSAVGRADARGVAEDPAQFFEYLFQNPHSLYQFPMTIAGALADQPREEPMISLDLGQEGGHAFNNLLFNFFNYQDDRRRAFNLKFPTAPNDLLVQMKRFYQHQNASRNQTVFGVNRNPIPVPANFELAGCYSQDAQGANYECDAFIVHYGHNYGHNGLNGGHYVAFVKGEDNTWWRCDDSRVDQIATEAAQQLMSQGYIYHYKKVSATA